MRIQPVLSFQYSLEKSGLARGRLASESDTSLNLTTLSAEPHSPKRESAAPKTGRRQKFLMGSTQKTLMQVYSSPEIA